MNRPINPIWDKGAPGDCIQAPEIASVGRSGLGGPHSVHQSVLQDELMIERGEHVQGHEDENHDTQEGMHRRGCIDTTKPGDGT